MDDLPSETPPLLPPTPQATETRRHSHFPWAKLLYLLLIIAIAGGGAMFGAVGGGALVYRWMSSRVQANGASPAPVTASSPAQPAASTKMAVQAPTR